MLHPRSKTETQSITEDISGVQEGADDPAPLAEGAPGPLRIAGVQVDPDYDALFAPKPRGFLGADGALSVPIDARRTLFVFGDTFVGTLRDGRRQGPMIHNSIAILEHDHGRPVRTEHFWDLTHAIPGDFFHDGFEADHYYWPGTGVAANGRIYLFLMKMATTDESNPAAFFQILDCTLVRIENPLDSPREWRITLRDLGHGSQRFALCTAALVERPFVYLLGFDDGPTDQPANRAAILARIPLDALESDLPGAALEFLSDDHRWVHTRDRLAALFRPGMTESSLHYDPIRRRYVSVMIPPFSTDLCLMSTERLEGPWSPPQKILHIPDHEKDPTHHAYAGKVHPSLTTDRPDELLVSYVVNTTDFWAVFETCDIYYPRFVRVRLSRDAEESHS